jgi:hypothetical protein
LNADLFFSGLQSSRLGVWINTVGAVYPIIETLHVIALSLVFGTILIVDLRLLGLASMSRPFTHIARDLLRITWSGFALSVVTGCLLFVANAGSMYANRAFQIKMVLMFVAGLNMLVFERITARHVSVWDLSASPPNAARIAGLLSICLWLAVIVFGRLVGFTTDVEDPFAALPRM